MSYEVKYPVDFKSGGDSVKDAFGKHIEEFITVYGILNELAENDLTDAQRVQLLESLTADIPMSRVTGTLPVSRITGDLPVSRVTGDLPGSRISGEITKAKISPENVTGLDEHVKDLVTGDIPASKLVDGIKAEPKGYVAFGGGLIIQWGYVDFEEGAAGAVTRQTSYAVPYPNACYGVFLSDGKNAGIFDGKISTATVMVSLVRDTATAAYRVYYLSIGA